MGIGVQALRGDYAGVVNRCLRPKRKTKYTALDIYSGAGGLSLGLEAAGFSVTGIDSDPDCCDTYSSNLVGDCMNDHITPRYDFPRADVVVGGPPCQPFSVHGKQLGREDARNGIPSFISAVKKIRPRMWIFENVRGITYRNGEYFKASIRKLGRLGYSVDVMVVNCADYGVPQNRERVIAVGHDGSFSYPGRFDGTVAVRDALRDIPAKRRERPSYLTPSMDRYIRDYERASQCSPRDLNMGRPARTLTCRNLAGHSSDMHRIKRGGRRRLLYRIEASRLQSFPDWFVFKGKRGSVFNQIGNAVPPLLALMIGGQAVRCLDGKPGLKKNR